MTRTFALLAAGSLAVFASACGNGRHAPATAPAPPPAPVAAPEPVAAAPAPTVGVCIVQAGELREVPVTVGAGDSLLADGRRLADVYPETALTF